MWCNKDSDASPFYQTQTTNCNLLRIEPDDNAGQGQYQINSKDNSIGYAGAFEISLWAKCGGNWDGDQQLLHSRWYDTSGTEIGTTVGGWFDLQEKDGADLVANCDSEVWRKISRTFDSGLKEVGKFELYVGYPMKASTGYLEITKISVKPIIWKAGGGSLQVRSTAGGGFKEAFSSSNGFDVKGGDAETQMVTKWLILGKQNKDRSSGQGPFEQGNKCGIHSASQDDTHAQDPTHAPLYVP